MATYKVPQDVEADDKLLGPFSFRQFIYLIIVAISGGLAWLLGTIFIPLAIIPLPVIILFGALALPLRKEQPMETYLAAIISFHIKPRKRLWDPDGQQALIEIIAPKTNDKPITKGLSGDEAERRLSYLAGVVDSRGWAVRGLPSADNTSMNSDAYFEAQQVQDVMDESNRTAQTIDNQISQSNTRHKQELMAQMQQPTPSAPALVAQPTVPQPQPQQVATSSTPALATAAPPLPAEPKLTFNPYPSINQSVVQPLSTDQSQLGPLGDQPTSQAPVRAQETPSEKPPSPGIISLASNHDLSIETIAREANRIKQRELPEEEVVISLH